MVAEALTSQQPQARVKPTHKPTSVGRQKVPVGITDTAGPIDRNQRWAPGEARRGCEGSSRPTGRPTQA